MAHEQKIVTFPFKWQQFYFHELTLSWEIKCGTDIIVNTLYTYIIMAVFWKWAAMHNK